MSPGRPRHIPDTVAAATPAKDSTESAAVAGPTAPGDPAATDTAEAPAAPALVAAGPIITTAVTPPVAANSAAPASPTSKFTVLLSPDDAATFDELTVTLRRHLARRVTKSDVVRILVTLAAQDPTLRHRLAYELQQRTT